MDDTNNNAAAQQDGGQQQQAPAIPAIPAIPDGKVLVDKDKLDTVLTRLDALERGKLEDAEKIKMLETVADQGRVAAFENGQAPKKLISTARVSILADKGEDKPVVGWKMVKDEVLYVEGKIVANQVTRLYLLEKEPDAKGNPVVTEVDMNYLDFVRRVSRVEGEIIKKSVDEESGATTYKLRLATGRQVEVDVRFINAF